MLCRWRVVWFRQTVNLSRTKFVRDAWLTWAPSYELTPSQGKAMWCCSEDDGEGLWFSQDLFGVEFQGALGSYRAHGSTSWLHSWHIQLSWQWLSHIVTQCLIGHSTHKSNEGKWIGLSHFSHILVLLIPFSRDSNGQGAFHWPANGKEDWPWTWNLGFFWYGTHMSHDYVGILWLVYVGTSNRSPHRHRQHQPQLLEMQITRARSSMVVDGLGCQEYSEADWVRSLQTLARLKLFEGVGFWYWEFAFLF